MAKMSAFVSWRMAESEAETYALQKELQKHGVDLVIVGELPGVDLSELVFGDIKSTDLVIIMATKMYGTKTSDLIDTRKEIQYTGYSLVTELG